MKHQFSGILNTQHRRAITAVIDQIRAKSDKYAFGLMPIVNRPEGILEHEILSSYGGMTNERVLGEPGKTIAGISSQSKVYMPGSYQESIPFNERDLLRLRRAGTIGERGVTGLTDGELSLTSIAAEKLQLRLENRMQKLIWDAFFTGKYNYNGTDYVFGIPEANELDSATDWSDPANGKPVADLVNVINGTDVTRKYIFKELVMNPFTAGKAKLAIMKEYGIYNSNVKNASIEELFDFYSPDLPPVRIVKDAYQTEAVSAQGETQASAAQFFVPNGKLLLVPDFGDSKYQQYGELQLTENMNDPSATIDKPAQGAYLFFDEKGLENKKSPSVEIVSGFNGGPNLMRPADVITLDVF